MASFKEALTVIGIQVAKEERTPFKVGAVELKFKVNILVADPANRYATVNITDDINYVVLGITVKNGVMTVVGNGREREIYTPAATQLYIGELHKMAEVVKPKVKVEPAVEPITKQALTPNINIDVDVSDDDVLYGASISFSKEEIEALHYLAEDNSSTNHHSQYNRRRLARIINGMTTHILSHHKPSHERSIGELMKRFEITE